MSDFPQWWGEPGSDPRLFHEGDPIPDGWVRHYGRYDVQIGQFVPDPDEPLVVEGADPFDHDGDGKPGGSKPRRKRKAK